MALPGFRREKHLLTVPFMDESPEYVRLLVRPPCLLAMLVTNLRNRPLGLCNLETLTLSLRSLHHNLCTGTKEYPLLPCTSLPTLSVLVFPFPLLGEMENSSPSPLWDAAPGVMLPTAPTSHPIFLSPVLPEKADIGVLRADPRNCVRTMTYEGESFIRVISSVYRTPDMELANRWRVTDYDLEGGILMSVLCQFTETSGDFPSAYVREAKGKRQRTGDTDPSPPKKRLRL